MQSFNWTQSEINRIVVSALRNCIEAHGPITKDQIGSAAKRISTGLFAIHGSIKVPVKNRAVRDMYALHKSGCSFFPPQTSPTKAWNTMVGEGGDDRRERVKVARDCGYRVKRVRVFELAAAEPSII